MGLFWYLAIMAVMVANSGLVLCDSQIRDPTRFRSFVIRSWLGGSWGFGSGTEI